MSNVEVKGTPVRLAKRGISEATCKLFGCYKDGQQLRFYYRDRSGSLCAAKVKTPEKEFWWEGKNKDHQLFGQNLFPNAGKRVVIFEGELDAMSGYTALPNWPMVSVPDGAPSAKAAVQRQLEWLQGYEEVVVFFDADKEGRAAAESVASILPPGKVKIAHLPEEFKDASDALQAGNSDAIRKAIWNAESWRPGGIVSGKDLLSVVTAPSPTCDHDYPWQGLQDKLHGIRYRELVTITAGSGIGKSSLCRELATHLLETGQSVGYIALEESNRRTALGLMSSKLGKSFHLLDSSAEELKAAYDSTIAGWNLFLFDGFGSYDPQVVYNCVEYMALGLDVKIVFLDHLSILLSGLEGDERKMIDETMTRLRSLVERTGIALFLVCHVSGDDNGKPYEEGGRVKLNKLRGSRAIGQLSDAVIALERDQQQGTATDVRVLKNRYTGEVGVACSLTYSLEECKFSESSFSLDDLEDF